MTTGLERNLKTSLQKARDWVGDSKEARTVRAFTALIERDADALHSLVVAYVTLHKGGVGASTEASYARAVALLSDTGYNLARLSSEEAALVLRGLETRFKPGTVGVYKSRLKVFYDALAWVEAYRGGANPFQNLRHRPERSAPEDQFDLYDDFDLRRLLSVATPEERALLLLGAHGALRASEMANLKLEHVALTRGNLRVVSGKGGKTRTVPLTNTLKAALGALQPRGDYVLPERDRFKVSRTVESVCAKAGVTFERKGVHGLRHYGGTKAYQALPDLLRVARFMGHAGVDTTMRYARTDVSGFDGSFVEEFRKVLSPAPANDVAT